MSDTIEIIGSSLVKHCPESQHAYLMKLDPADAAEIVGYLEQLACSRGYTAIFAKVPAGEARRFVAAGYHQEAVIMDYFPEGGAVCFMARYLSAERKRERQPLPVRQILASAHAQHCAGATTLPAEFSFRVAAEGDAAGVAAVHREVFGSHDPAVIGAAMNRGAIFFGIWREDTIVALACAEIDLSTRSAEMTGFAALPDYSGCRLPFHLLQQMERSLLTLGIRLAFTIVRACSLDMNLAFSGNGYRFGGTLTNSTSMSGRLESGNVWYKALPDDPKLTWKFFHEAKAGAAGACPLAAD